MKKYLKSILLVFFVFAFAISFSAISCSITPTPSGYTVTVYNNFGAGITVDLYVNGIKEATVPNGSFSARTVLSGNLIRVYDATHSSWLAISEDLFWYDSYTIYSNTNIAVKYNILDLFHAEIQ